MTSPVSKEGLCFWGFRAGASSCAFTNCASYPALSAAKQWQELVTAVQSLKLSCSLLEPSSQHILCVAADVSACPVCSGNLLP